MVGLKEVADPRRPGSVIRTIPVIAHTMRADRALVYAESPLPPGTPVLFPLDTIDGESVLQTGEVESCHPVENRGHKVFVRFRHALTPEDFVVCWGLSVSDDGYGRDKAHDAVDIALLINGPALDDAARRELASLGDRLARAARLGEPDDAVRAIITRIAEAGGAV